MNDRELLELAAKAAGLLVAHIPLSGFNIFDGTRSGRAWNPLADDGDAMRLAAELDLFGSTSDWHCLAIARLENSVDRSANARRAIVRAAAEIGAKMQGE